MKLLYLPQLKSVKIDNYSLYYQQPTFEFNFLDGISSIVGGNGIGKTTFVEIIMYCLVGHKRTYPVLGTKKQKIKEKISNPDFFKVRMNDGYLNNKLARASLTFKINKSEITVVRSLYENKIIYLKVDAKEYVEPSEQIYNEEIIKASRISSFQLFDNIVRKFLLFDEGRQNIAWEPELQDEILRTLFFDEDIYFKFRDLAEKVVKFDTDGRHLSEDRRVISESLDSLKEEKEKLFEGSQEAKSDNNILSVSQTKNRLEQEELEINSELEVTRELLQELNEKYNTLFGERNEISLEVDAIDTQISKDETKLFNNIYNTLPDFYLPLEKTMINEGKCLVCGTKNKELKEIAETYRKNGKCLICSSEIIYEKEDEEILVDGLNQLYSKRKDLEIRVYNKEEFLNEIKEKITETSNLITKLKEELDKKRREIVYIKSKLSELNEDSTDTYSEIVKAKEERIKKLNLEIKEKYEKRDKTKKELMQLHNKFTSIINDLNKKLSMFFNKYASTFIGLECELTVKQKTINKIPHVLYIPKIDGVIRDETWTVSESQRFFLDQAFRMAIIDYLQNNINGFKTFFITETPEGSLDISYEEKVAEMFSLFAKSSNNIIFTSNLNSSKFLYKIYEQLEPTECKQRTLNLFSKGNLTKVQTDNSELHRIQEVLFGDGE